ncbi:flagellar motor stator protein MotA [Vibrio algivorus]|uniref:Flagellar motor stator protein MotA n=1 Tax=Vibrio algivorus TaxID=1667024 RepID=A0A557NV23_9VIBR|nr:flagellar motor stator protein MotA [Vibrio algivorus]TVO32276.1 flagellar motor stator protein MotA [Vibrio algivorus]
MKQILSLLGIVGLIIGIFMLHGGRLGALIRISEIILIFGVAILGLIVSSKISTIKIMIVQLKMNFGKSKYTKEYYNDLLSLMFELITIAKVQNIKALDAHVESPESSSIFVKYPVILGDQETISFIVDAFRLVISSKLPAHDIEMLLEEEIELLKEEFEKPSMKLHTMAEAMPGIGILAAVMGIILTMQNLDADVGIIGQSIAAALVGTFTGIFGCYCLFGPLSSAIHDVAEDQIAPLHCVRSVISAYCQNLTAHLCVNAGRKHIESSIKPSFIELEDTVNNLRTSST